MLPKKLVVSKTTAIGESQAEPVRHLNQVELSRRWQISPRTLERWRWRGQGPSYLKIGGRVVYRLDDVERYEAQRMRMCKATVAEASPRAGNP